MPVDREPRTRRDEGARSPLRSRPPDRRARYSGIDGPRAARLAASRPGARRSADLPLDRRAGAGPLFESDAAAGRGDALVVDPHAREVAPTPPPQSGPGCYTLACERERLEERERRRAEAERREAEERAARAAREPRAPRGLSFAKYISIQRGITEGELLAIAGEPDLVSDHGIAIAAPSTIATGRGQAGAARAGLTLKTWTYLPTVADPFVTTITLVGGRVSEIERVRKF
ncbi:MAG: hypothetical protein RML56_00570 [Burkholderiales bacterium]|nr:hypothetical protein [Burkholderiales bacterium]